MTKGEKRLAAVWVILICLTLLSYLANGILRGNASAVIVSVIAAAFFKVRFVVLDFMEVRDAPLGLRMLLEGWLILLAGTLCYLLVCPA